VKPNAPVVGLDIDGTLAPWHEHFRQFIQCYTGKPCPPGEEYVKVEPWDGSVPFYRWLGVSKATYREAKLAFRQGGYKRWMPTYAGASEVVRNLRSAGCEVWICTTRPYLRLDNIDPDTRHWLRRNRIKPDGVIFGEHKYRDLKKCVGRNRVMCVVDDLPEMLAQAHGLGMPVLLRAQPYNVPSAWPVSARGLVVQRIGDMYGVQQALLSMLDVWKGTAR
jgi:hypothetical protein